jgi:hypothetical protein
MRLGLLDSRALFPFFHPTLPVCPAALVAHYGGDSRKQSVAGNFRSSAAQAAPGGEADLRRCTVRLRLCSHFRLLQRVIDINASRNIEVDVGGCWYCLDKCGEHYVVRR